MDAHREEIRDHATTMRRTSLSDSFAIRAQLLSAAHTFFCGRSICLCVARVPRRSRGPRHWPIPRSDPCANSDPRRHGTIRFVSGSGASSGGGKNSPEKIDKRRGFWLSRCSFFPLVVAGTPGFREHPNLAETRRSAATLLRSRVSAPACHSEPGRDCIIGCDSN